MDRKIRNRTPAATTKIKSQKTAMRGLISTTLAFKSDFCIKCNRVFDGDAHWETGMDCGHILCSKCARNEFCALCGKAVTNRVKNLVGFNIIIIYKINLQGDEYEKDRRKLAGALQRLNTFERVRRQIRKANAQMTKAMKEKEEKERAYEQEIAAFTFLACIAVFSNLPQFKN